MLSTYFDIPREIKLLNVLIYIKIIYYTVNYIGTFSRYDNKVYIGVNNFIDVISFNPTLPCLNVWSSHIATTLFECTYYMLTSSLTPPHIVGLLIVGIRQ